MAIGQNASSPDEQDCRGKGFSNMPTKKPELSLHGVEDILQFGISIKE